MLRSDRAFTLVELLVVIGIISVLVSLLLPSLSRARESANAIKCASNMKQLGTWLVMYANDNRGYIPPMEPYRAAGSPRFSETSRFYTRLAQGGYLPKSYQFSNTDMIMDPDKSVLRCPSDTTDPLLGSEVRRDLVQGNQNNRGTSYMFNTRVVPFHTSAGASCRPDGSLGPAPGPAFKVTKYSKPSGRLVATERNSNSGRYAGGLRERWYQEEIVNNVAARHGKGGANGIANVLFLDGHVAAMNRKEIIAPAERALADPDLNPNPDPQNLWGIFAED